MGVRAPNPPQQREGSPVQGRVGSGPRKKSIFLSSWNFDSQAQGTSTLSWSPISPAKQTDKSSARDLISCGNIVNKWWWRSLKSPQQTLLPGIPMDLTQHNHMLDNIRAIYDPVDRTEENVDDDRLWMKSFAASAVRTFHKQEKTLKDGYMELGLRLTTIGRSLKENPDDTNEVHLGLDSIIDELTLMVTKRGNRHRRKKRGTRNGRRKGRNNRTARRSSNYAKVQELATND